MLQQPDFTFRQNYTLLCTELHSTVLLEKVCYSSVYNWTVLNMSESTELSYTQVYSIALYVGLISKLGSGKKKYFFPLLYLLDPAM